VTDPHSKVEIDKKSTKSKVKSIHIGLTIKLTSLSQQLINYKRKSFIERTLADFLLHKKSQNIWLLAWPLHLNERDTLKA
jgi:hypothetical protein